MLYIFCNIFYTVSSQPMGKLSNCHILQNTAQTGKSWDRETVLMNY